MKKSPHIALIRPGSACKSDADPEFVRNWLIEEHQIPAEYHPDTQKWLDAEQRAKILLEFLSDDRLTTLWAFRGGEGSADILPYLQLHAKEIKKAKPKLILGISDATALLNYFNQVFHWPVAHACGAVKVARGEVDAESVKLTLDLIQDPNLNYMIPHLIPLNTHAEQAINLSAPLCGGNLSMLAISVKDIWEIQAANKILILEDVDEKSFQISRMLNYLQRIGLFNKVKAIILGEFVIHTEEQKQAITKALQRFAQSCPFPVLQTSTFGHGSRCIPLPFYRPVELFLGQPANLNIT